MAREFAIAFYQSSAWKKTRKAYMSYRHGLCELCQNSAEIVHHKKHLTPRNIDNPEIALAWNNLQCVCRECHAKIHEGVSVTADGLRFNADGDLEAKPPIKQKRGAFYKTTQ